MIHIPNTLQAIRITGIFDEENQRHQAGSIYSIYGLSPTIDTGGGGWRQPLIFGNKTK